MTDTTWVGRLLWLAAAGFMQLRLIANLLDGMVAIEGGKQSTIGELFNEVPDRLTDTAILVGAGYAAGSLPVLGTLGAIVSLFIAYVRAMGASAGVGQVFLGPMAKPQRMAILTITCVLHAILPAYWLYSASDRYSLIALSLALIIVGGVVTAVRRLLRIAALMKQSASGVD